MPASEEVSRTFTTTSLSRSRPTVDKIGAESLAMSAGLALCATTQMEQAAASVALG